MQIAFIGGGAMAEAMVRGILDRGLVEASNIVVGDINAERLTYLGKEYGVDTTLDSRSAVADRDIVVLAIKPVTLPKVMKDLKGLLYSNQMVISVVAGATLAQLCQNLEHKIVVRAMPNMPARIGEGMTVWTVTSEVKMEHKQQARSIMLALGKEVFMPDERYIDMATAVSGSGPAYVFLIIESFIDAAVRIGLPDEQAKILVLETILGATHLVQKSAEGPTQLRNLVASPGGTTAEGLYELDEGGLRDLLYRAIVAGYEKAKNLGTSR